MTKAAKRVNGNYIEAGYKDKIVFRRKKSPKARRAVVASWRRSQGLWAAHPVFHGMTVREIVEWLRGEDSDV
ncbi:MAG: hypothetical protein HW419_569 [Deltaproteobacteria bacterium]|nr:hypothetical protein [Deltaproteobacteria bacterium]